MVAIDFKPQFADAVASGKKLQTIRAKTKAFRGCELQLYTGLRTKACRKLRDAICESVVKIVLYKTLAQPLNNAAVVGPALLDEFAKRDGFKTYAEMWAFFEPRADENGEFHGFLIKW